MDVSVVERPKVDAAFGAGFLALLVAASMLDLPEWAIETVLGIAFAAGLTFLVLANLAARRRVRAWRRMAEDAGLARTRGGTRAIFARFPNYARDVDGREIVASLEARPGGSLILEAPSRIREGARTDLDPLLGSLEPILDIGTTPRGVAVRLSALSLDAPALRDRMAAMAALAARLERPPAPANL